MVLRLNSCLVITRLTVKSQKLVSLYLSINKSLPLSCVSNRQRFRFNALFFRLPFILLISPRLLISYFLAFLSAISLEALQRWACQRSIPYQPMDPAGNNPFPFLPKPETCKDRRERGRVFDWLCDCLRLSRCLQEACFVWIGTLLYFHSRFVLLSLLCHFFFFSSLFFHPSAGLLSRENCVDCFLSFDLKFRSFKVRFIKYLSFLSLSLRPCVCRLSLWRAQARSERNPSRQRRLVREGPAE